MNVSSVSAYVAIAAIAAAGLLVTALIAGGCRSPASTADATAERGPRPNVVVLMTDDQTVADLEVMPRVQQLLGAHNHHVLGLYPPTGGYGRFDAGETPAEPPPGWSEWYGAVGYSTYRMWGYTLNENGENLTYGTPLEQDPALYQTDVLARRAVDVIERRAAARAPLFLSVAFLAPHHEGKLVRRFTGHLVRPAPRHTGLLEARPLSPSPAFNEQDVSDKPPFVRRRPPLDPAQIDRITRNQQDRREALLAVDEAVAEIFGALGRAGALENTYVIFTSDNGFMQGEHRVPSGKLLPYDPSSRVPLIVRGASLPAGAQSGALVGNVDLAPTILELAQAEPGRLIDGQSLLPFARDPSRGSRRPLLHETGGRRFAFGREQDAAGAPAAEPVLNYKAVRTARWRSTPRGTPRETAQNAPRATGLRRR